METKRIQIQVRSLRDDEIEEHVRLLKGVDRVEFIEEPVEPRSHKEFLKDIGERLWQVRDRKNPGILDVIIAEICEECDCDFSNIPVTGRYEVLTPKNGQNGNEGADIAIWVTGDVDVVKMSSALGKIRGVSTVETL